MSRQRASFRTMSLICELKALDRDRLLVRARALLDVYRRIASITLDDTEMTVAESKTHYAGNDSFVSDIRAGLSYLADFEPHHKKSEFEAKVTRLFETQWMMGLIELALERVRHYSNNGMNYYDILHKSYFSKRTYKNDDLQEIYGLEHSSFFDFKKEAVLLFGIYFWGYIIPEVNRGSAA